MGKRLEKEERVGNGRGARDKTAVEAHISPDIYLDVVCSTFRRRPSLAGNGTLPWTCREESQLPPPSIL